MPAEYLELTNFQPHAARRIDFDPYLTVLIGDNGVGKTAFMRALLWICTNQGKPEKFIKWGTTGVTAKLGIDGHTIQRHRGKNGDNTYQLDDGPPLRAFGRDVPDVVQRVLDLGPHNFQTQHAAHFLIFDTGGQVVRLLNAVVDLDVIDTAQAAILQTINQTTKAHEAAELALTSAEEALEAAPDCSLAAVRMAEMRTSRDKAAVARDRATRAAKAGATIKECSAALVALRDARAGVAAVLAFAEASQRAHQRLARARKAATTVKEANIFLAKAANHKRMDLDALLQAATKARADLTAARRAVAAYKKASEDLATIRKTSDDHRKLLETVTVKEGEVQTCPTCRRPLP